MKCSRHIAKTIVGFFVAVSCFGQEKELDSLHKVLAPLKDTARIDALVALFVYHMHHDNFDSAIYYARIRAEEAQKINYIHGIAAYHTANAAMQLRIHKNFPEAEKEAKDALKWYEKTNNKKDIEIAYWLAGAAIFFQYKYDEATPYLDSSYSWSEKHKNPEWMFHVLGFKYENYRDIGDYEKAFDAFQKNQQLQQALDGKIDPFFENYALAELQRRIGNYADALTHYHKVIAAFKDLQKENIWYRISYPELYALNNKLDSAEYYYNLIDSSKLTKFELPYYFMSLGEFYLLKKDYTKANVYSLKGLHGHRAAGDSNYTKRDLIAVAKSYAALGKNDEAIAYARQAFDLSSQTRAKQYLRDACEILYEVYQRTNPQDSAFKYYQKYIEQKEIVANDNVKGKFAAYNYEQQIGSLNKEKQLQQQQLSQTAEQRKYLIIGITGLLFLGIFLVRNITLKRRNEANRRTMVENELLLQKFEHEKTKAEMEQQTTELEMQALRAQMNPHFIFNSLNSINRFILQNNKAQASEYLTKFSKLVRMILQNSQASLITLESELEALKIYLDLEALRFEHHFTYDISVPKDLDIEVLKVPPLIIQPYAENAIWHGLMHKEDKGQLIIEVTQEENHLQIKITDDGIGRKQAAALKTKSATKHKSVGLKITAARIAMMQSENEDDSSIKINDLVNADGSAAGTEVLLKLPVQLD